MIATSNSTTTEHLSISEEMVDSYLETIEGTTETIATYRYVLTAFCRWLPNSELFVSGMEEYQQWLVEKGLSVQTIKMRMALINRFLLYYDARIFLWEGAEDLVDTSVQPELTRAEYIRLLDAARHRPSPREYLLVTAFATIGLTVNDLHRLTVEAVERGSVIVYPGHAVRNYRIPPCVQEKLRIYATRAGIKTGPIFVTRDGTPLHRSTVFAYVQRLARDARVVPEKCNPRCLRKLHGTTIEAITRDLSLLIDMTYDRLLEQEELSCGWIEQW